LDLRYAVTGDVSCIFGGWNQHLTANCLPPGSQDLKVHAASFRKQGAAGSQCGQ